MENIIILFAMLFCLFGPTVIFTIVGMNSMEKLCKRPSKAPAVMIGLALKFIAVTFVLIGAELVLLKVFAPK